MQIDTSENSSQFFNSFKTQRRLNENSGQNTKKLLPVKKQKQPLEVLRKGALRNFTKFTRKRLPESHF